MSKLKMKAKAGVTLVELLVVILIVTILSVSMLPLLQPFVTEAQYAAEAIPVIGNLRTKIGLYQYDKGQLPYETKQALFVQTWIAGQSATVDDGNGGQTTTPDTEKFGPAYYTLPSGKESVGSTRAMTETQQIAEHVGTLIDVDYQDLKGKRSKPPHYQYYPISATNNFSYVVACFGDGQGLKAGTGYAVCELNFTKAGKKYIGTWKRYKPTDDSAGAIKFGTTPASDASVKLDYCYVPAADEFQPENETGIDEPTVVQNMKKSGWEF